MSTEHPDEGTIHAWLDDGLSAADSARVAAHVASCAPCSAAAAEARGLIAGASRVVKHLDEAPTGRTWGAPVSPVAPAGSGSLWRALRVTPARAALAATLLVALGIGLTHDWVARDSVVSSKAGSMALATADSARPRDALLDSAIARNIAQALPPRTLERAPGVEIPSAPPSPSAPAGIDDPAAPLRVAAGRRAVQARRETAVLADQASANDARAVAAAAPPAECLRIESGMPDARWGGAALPLVVALGGSAPSGEARVVGAAPGDTLRARWQRTAGDSLRLDLRGGAWSGAIELAAGDAVRSGTMRSTAPARLIAEVTTPGAAAPAPTAARAPSPRVQIRGAPAPGAAAAGASAESAASRPVAVTARRVRCP